jgi:hypothetical protein
VQTGDHAQGIILAPLSVAVLFVNQLVNVKHWGIGH